MAECKTMAKKKSKSGESLVYVIAGKDEPLVGARCDELLDELVDPAARATGLFDADPDTTTASQVLDELRTLPFLTDRRVVVVKKADSFISRYRSLLESYFDDPCPTGILVMTASKWDSRTKLAKKLPKIGTYISIEPPKRSELPKRLAQYAADAHGKKLSKGAAELLVEISSDELARLYGEIDKLAIYADKEKTITEDHIEALIGHNRVFGAFEVIDAIADGHSGKAVAELRNMFAQDRSAEYTVVGAFAYHLRQLFGAKAGLDKGMRPFDICKQVGIWHRKEQLLAQARRMKLDQIAACLEQLGQVDHAIKTGRTNARVAMEQFVLRLAES